MGWRWSRRTGNAHGSPFKGSRNIPLAHPDAAALEPLIAQMCAALEVADAASCRAAHNLKEDGCIPAARWPELVELLDRLRPTVVNGDRRAGAPVPSGTAAVMVTSGTAGVPLRWLDTEESWQWMLGNWERILRVAQVKAADRVFFAFSFGPFIGFWLAFEAAKKWHTQFCCAEHFSRRNPTECCWTSSGHIARRSGSPFPEK